MNVVKGEQYKLLEHPFRMIDHINIYICSFWQSKREPERLLCLQTDNNESLKQNSINLDSLQDFGLDLRNLSNEQDKSKITTINISFSILSFFQKIFVIYYNLLL